MAEEIATIQEQDFLPVKKPGLGQRLSWWLKNLTPKKRLLFWLAVIGGAVVVAAVLYFTLAAGEEVFYFELEESHDALYVGQTYHVKAMFNPQLGQADLVDKINIQVEVILPDANWLGEPEVQGLSFAQNKEVTKNDKIINAKIEGINNNWGGSMDVLVIPLTIPTNAKLGERVKFKFNSATWVDGTQTEHTVPMSSMKASEWQIKRTLTGKVANLTLISPTSNINDFTIGQEFEVDLMLEEKTTDVIALEALLKYDKDYLDFRSGKLADFEQGKVQLKSAGSVYILAGTMGDGDVKTGIKSANKVAVLKFKAKKLISDQKIYFDLSEAGVQLVADDGQGTLITDFGAGDLEYRITMIKPMIDKGPEVQAYQDSGWKADVYWTTNMETVSNKVYLKEKSSNVVDCKDESYDTLKDSNTTKSKEHNFTLDTLDGLAADKTYCVKVASNDDPQDASREAVGYAEFSTSVAKNEFKIVNLSARPGRNNAILSWSTVGGEAAGLGTTELGGCSPSVSDVSGAVSDNYTLTHSLKLNNLSVKTKYRCTVKSTPQTGQPVEASVDFETTAAAELDANKILKVERDRECEQWLFCRSALQIVNKSKQTENMCFDLGLCEELGPDGGCAKIVTADLQAEQIFQTPAMVDQVANLSGLSKVGLQWGKDKLVNGYYPYPAMKTAGESIKIPNGDFEGGSTYPWSADKTVDRAEIRLATDVSEKTNHVLVIQSTSEDGWSHAYVPVGAISNSKDYPYAVSLGIRSNGAPLEVQIQFMTASRRYYTLRQLTTSSNWQTVYLLSNQPGSQFVGGSVSRVSGYLNIAFKNEAEAANNVIYIDNVSTSPLLAVSSDVNTGYRQNMCRLYPSASASSCDYIDMSGKQYRGWRGYCVEPDPKYDLSGGEKMCLNWWPVDILPGETDVFGTDEQAGYTGRTPLYFCLAAEGNYPYLKSAVIVKGYCETKGDMHLHSDFYLTNDKNKGNPEERLFNIKEVGGGENLAVKTQKEQIERVVVKWHYARDDDPCTGKNDELTLELSHQNNFFNSETTENAYFEFYLTDDGKLEVRAYPVKEQSKGNGTITSIILDFYFREPCTVLAQVVGVNGENAAWASRLVEGGWRSENELGYEYKSDYLPYGAAVVPAPASDPTQWEQPLIVMPADKSLGAQAPYQARAGLPYGVLNEGNDTVGYTQCISGSGENLGKGCKSAADCGYNTSGEGQGLCMGANLTDLQRKTLKDNSGWDNAIKRLSKLFAKAIKVWIWEEDYASDPTGNIRRYVETKDISYVWNYTSQADSKTRPKVNNIKVNDRLNGGVELQGPVSVSLKFNSEVDINHLPLTSFRIDWGDGTPLSQVNNLRIYPKDKPEKPHVLFHIYECKGNNPCVYVPKVQIEDNWGWCSSKTGASKCSDNSAEWQEFSGSVMVKP